MGVSSCKASQSESCLKATVQGCLPSRKKIRKLRLVCKWRRIDLCCLFILFSQYKSSVNTQEDWSFVLLTKKNACKHEYVSMRSLMNKRKHQTSWVLSHDLSWENKMYKRKRSIGSANQSSLAIYISTELRKGAAHDIGLKAHKGAPGCRYTVHVDVAAQPECHS